MNFILTVALALSTLSVNAPCRFDDETLMPNFENVLLGTFNSGGNLASWAANDGDLRRICKFFAVGNSGFTRVNLRFATTFLHPSTITFKVRISAKTGGRQEITLRIKQYFNNVFVTTSAVRVPISNTPIDISGTPPGVLGDFVGPNGEMEAQIEVYHRGLRAASYPCVSFDSGNLIVSN